MKRLLTTCSVIALLALFSTQIIAATTGTESNKTIRGRLQKTVEPGGWLVVDNTQKFLLINAQRFQNESWFKEGVEVEAVGETRDVMSVYMEGTPFEAQSLKPSTQGGNQIVSGADKRVTRVIVSGDSLVQALPDTAILTISVVTQAKSAIDAQQQNAAQSDAVVRTLRTAAGAGAEVKTSGYSLQPQRIYRENQPPTISGYEARNTVTVTIGDLTKVGPVIDAAAQSGANDIGGVAFTLRKDRPARDEALALATREAMSKAQVIAQALGGRVVRIVEVLEEGTVRPRPMYDAEMLRGAQKSVATPIEIGTLDISGRVQIVAEVEN